MKNKKRVRDLNILVTGGAGFLGSYIVKRFQRMGAKNIIIPRSRDIDLRLKRNCLRVTKGVNLVVHLAANVGGIGKNRDYPGTLFYDNVIMGIELMEAARVNKVSKFVGIGTICAYPKYASIPFREEDLWLGYPEETNAPYGLAKKMLLVQSQAYRQEFGFNSIHLLPVNLYGPGDNFDPASSHVIPALIRKIIEAKEAGLDYIEVWGDGTPTREFLYVEDAAKGIVLASLHYDKSDPVNLGSGMEISIKDLTILIARLLNFKSEIRYDVTKPNGQPRRMLDVSKAEKHFKFRAKTSFEEGLRKTIKWFLKNRKDIINANR